MTRSRTNPLLPLLALGLTLGLAASARAQDRQYQSPSGTAASLRISFGSMCANTTQPAATIGSNQG